MSLLEGDSNHVMNDAVGARLLPGFAQLHERFERRNEAPRRDGAARSCGSPGST